MSKRRGFPEAPIAFAIGVGVGMLSLGVLSKLSLLPTEQDVDHYKEVRDFVLDRSVDEPAPEELVREALTGMVGSLDEYSRYLSSDTETSSFNRETQGSFTGIGVVFEGPIEGGRVLFPMGGSPAEEAGVSVGDLITAVDGVALAGKTEREARALFTGEAGSTAILELTALDGTQRSAEVIRESVLDPTVRHPHLIDEERRIGYLALTSFSRETGAEFERTMTALLELGLEGLIIDLRGNPGGVLTAAVEIAEYFISEGVITKTRGRGASIVYEKTNEGGASAPSMPLTLLVDGGSASASEVLAGALQDHRTAVLIGSPTYGKARVQSVHHFEEAQAIVKVTSSYYTTPSGRNLDRSPERPWGIKPDLSVKVDAQTEALIHRHIRRYDPPEKAIKALFAWEDATGTSLLPTDPEDPQLEAALALLRGERPAGS